MITLDEFTLSFILHYSRDSIRSLSRACARMREMIGRDMALQFWNKYGPMDAGIWKRVLRSGDISVLKYFHEQICPIKFDDYYGARAMCVMHTDCMKACHILL
jgi:hypothetical protein